MNTTTEETLKTYKDRTPLPTRTVIPVASTEDQSSDILDKRQTLLSLQTVELPATSVRPKSTGPTRYSTLFFRVLLVSAIGLTLLGMSRQQTEPVLVPFTPEISTGDLQINPQSDDTSVDDPPPDIFIQPSE